MLAPQMTNSTHIQHIYVGTDAVIKAIAIFICKLIFTRFTNQHQRHSNLQPIPSTTSSNQSPSY